MFFCCLLKQNLVLCRGGKGVFWMAGLLWSWNKESSHLVFGLVVAFLLAMYFSCLFSFVCLFWFYWPFMLLVFIFLFSFSLFPFPRDQMRGLACCLKGQEKMQCWRKPRLVHYSSTLSGLSLFFYQLYHGFFSLSDKWATISLKCFLVAVVSESLFCHIYCLIFS